MAQGMEILAEVWENRKGPAVLTTVDSAKTPNAVYVGEIWYEADIGFIVADNYFHKTRENIKDGSVGSVLFITTKGKSYQVKGPLAYHTEGALFEKMKSRHDPKHPGVAATVLEIEEIYSGAEKLF